MEMPGQPGQPGQRLADLNSPTSEFEACIRGIEEATMANFKTFTLTLRPVGKGPPAIIRLRRALKYLLRVCGLRCIRLAEDADGQEKHG
jgi:hypothetical protein